MMKKSCELCKSPAKIYCESDQASLCWTCDTKVHSANFLVARHSRSLLCRDCRSPTPWTASGEKIGPSAVSVCEKCVAHRTSDGVHDDGEEIRRRNDVVDVNDANDENDDNDDIEDNDDEYDGDEDGETDVEDEEDGDDNQVVPLAYTPPPAASSSSEDDYCYSSGRRCVSVKRKRDNVADLSEDDGDCLSVQKSRRESSPAASGEAIEGTGRTLYQFLPSCSEAMGEKQKIQILPHQHQISGVNSSGMFTGIYEGTRTVGLDLNSSDS